MVERHKSLEIAFESKALRTICEDDAAAQAEVGEELARILMNRLADLRSAETFRDLLVGNPRIDQDSQQLLVNLSDGVVLAFEANHVSNPVTPDKRVDWIRVSRIKLERIDK